MPESLPTVRLYNSLTRQLEALDPITPGRVTIYTCGSTVYRYAHIGNLRTYLFGDLLRRVLDYLGYEVLYAKNITDVGHMRETGEDPILVAAEVEGKTPMDIAQFYADAWLEDERLLNMEPADVMPRATDHIPEMVAMTHTLLERGLAYEVDGNVYYDVSEFPGYGQLSGQKLDQMRAGHRVDVEADKRDPEDFALWKAAEPGRLMKWPSPWGEGFPGWHIECSAMSMKYLGERFDIHTGGIDLKFPHHEDEIAQSEGVTGHPVVSIWLHGEFLTMAEAKMAKSAGNTIRVSDLPDKGFEPLAFRYLALTAHYRSKLDFTESSMTAATAGLRRLRRAVREGATDGADVDLSAEPMAGYRARFVEAISEDLGMPAALAVAHAVASADDLTPPQRRALLLDYDRVLGLSIDAPVDEPPTQLPAGASELLEQRAAARVARDFATSDRLRDELAALGVQVRDTPDGQEVASISAKTP
jgi:cysteinyl-tRNA synthetase